MVPFRLLDLTLPSPVENLALDEALLDDLEENGSVPILHSAFGKANATSLYWGVPLVSPMMCISTPAGKTAYRYCGGRVVAGPSYMDPDVFPMPS